MTDQAQHELITVNEAAALLRIHPRTIQRWAREGLIKVVKIRQKILIPRSEFTATAAVREAA